MNFLYHINFKGKKEGVGIRILVFCRVTISFVMEKPLQTIISWNVNGIRAGLKKGFLNWLEKVQPDILCIQETKAHPDQLSKEILHPNGYVGIWNGAERRGYSGVATFTKIKPLLEISHFGEDLLDEEGRVILTEYPEFYLFNVYFPNGRRDQGRLEYKLKFYNRMLKLMDEFFQKGKAVILCGDINTAHKEIDLARPKANETCSGFLPIERKWLDELEKHDYVDTFRYFYPDQREVYSWWDMQTRARERNVGWRLDYVWAHRSLIPKIKEAFVFSEVMGSDHCPVGIRMKF